MSDPQTNAAAHLVAPDDMVAYLMAAATPGTGVRLQGAGAVGTVTIHETIPAFHKIALRDIRADETIWRGGWPIGRATADIATGAHVHTHNLVSAYSTPLKETE